MTRDDLIEDGLDRLEEGARSAQGRFWNHLRRSRPALIVLAVATAFLQLRELPENFAMTTLNAATILGPALPARHVRLVTIDEADYQEQFGGISPLDPQKLADLLRQIASGKPSVIVVDIDTSHSRFRSMSVPPDLPIVWAAPNSSGEEAPFNPEQPLGGRTLPAHSLAALDLIPRDKQGMVRSYARRFAGEHGQFIPSLEYAASEAYRTGAIRFSSLKDAGDERLMDFKYQFPPALSARRIQQESALAGWPRGLIHGEVVVFGGSYREARDRHATPVKLMSGAEIVAQGIEDEIENTGIRPVSSSMAGLLELVAGVTLILIYRFLGLRRAFLISLALIPALSIFCSWILFGRFALSLALLPVLVSLLITELYAKGSLYLKLCEKEVHLRQESAQVAAVKEDEGVQKARGQSAG